MIFKSIFLKPILFIVIFIFLMMGPVTANRAVAYEFVDWEHGEVGYELALMDAEDEEKPLILYFQVDTSDLCKKMNDDYFAIYEIEEFLRDLPKAEIDPDKGESEKILADNFGVKEYPTFFVFIPSLKTKLQRINPFSKDHNMTVNEFLKAIKGIIAYQYNDKAFSYYERKEHEKALKYFQRSLEFNPKKAYTYYAMGIIYQTMAHEKNDPKLVKKAEEYYSKALKIDPTHKESKMELEKLRKDTGEKGIKPKR